MTGIEYEETVAATRVETLIECFTAKCQVISLILALSDDGESETLVLQRNIEDSEDDEGVCLVLSPSQRCCYDPFTELILTRSSLGMRFTAEAREVFNTASILFTFDVADDKFDEVRKKLAVLCRGRTYFTDKHNAI